MTPEIVKALNSKEPLSPLNDALLTCAKNYVKGSRSKMAGFYDKWDFQDSVYRGERVPDNADLDARADGKPEKMIVPNTFAQVQFFISFLFLMYKQNRTFFELGPTGAEDFASKKQDAELILEQNLRKSQFNTVLYQNLADVAIRGPAFTACEWVRRTAKLRVPQAAVMQNLGGLEISVRPNSEYQDFVKFEGNEVRAVSPYRIFPDMAFPLSEALSRGRFCAYEEEYSMGELRDMAEAGEIAGVDNIGPLGDGWNAERGAATRTIADFNVRRGASGRVACGHAGEEGPVLVTKCRIWLVPKKFYYEGDESSGKVLGPEEHRVLYHVWYANDNVLIRVEPADEWHNTFGVTQMQFTPDMHHTINNGLADLVYRMQDVISWFINAHIKSATRIIQNRLVINTDAIESRSLDSDGDIYLKKGFGRRPVTDAVSQLQLSDVTAGFMGDAQIINAFMQIATGVNDNLQGQPNPRRVSAQENRVQSGSAAGRMKLHGHLLWTSGYGPLGELMLSNSRQGISEDVYRRIVGSQLGTPERYAIYKGDPAEVIAGDDFMVFDSTLSSEKGFAAQSLQELLSTILTVNPAAAIQLFQQIDPKKVFNEIQYLRNGSTADRFQYDPGTQPQVPLAGPQLVNNAA